MSGSDLLPLRPLQGIIDIDHRSACGSGVRRGMGTDLNELPDDLTHFCGELGLVDSPGGRVPIVCA